MPNNSLTDLHQLVWISLMAALVAAGAYIYVPIGPVPVSMQTFFVSLAGFVLGPRKGSMAIGLYLLAGAIGLPVFAGGKSGLGHLLGPTGGFLVGFGFSAMICGLAVDRDRTVSWIRGFLFGLIGMVALLLLGSVWLKFSLALTWSKTWAVAVSPFLLWSTLKVIAAVATCRYLARFKLLPMHA